MVQGIAEEIFLYIQPGRQVMGVQYFGEYKDQINENPANNIHLYTNIPTSEL